MLCTRSKEDWINRFVEWKNTAVNDCVSMLKGYNEQASWEEKEASMLEVNSRVDPIHGLKFFEDPSPSTEARDHLMLSQYAQLYRKAESSSGIAFVASTSTSTSA